MAYQDNGPDGHYNNNDWNNRYDQQWSGNQQRPPFGQDPYGNGPQGPNRQNPTSTQEFIGSIKTCISKYVDFNGRAGRPEFWWWTLVSFLLTGGFVLAPGLNYIVSIAMFIPSLAVTWRRLHDTGRAGGYFFIGLIPLVGWIILLIWLCQPSQPGPNRFGEGPDDILINRPPF